MSDTYGPFDLTYLEPAIDKVKDVAAWTEGFVQEITAALTTPEALGTFTGSFNNWSWSVTMHRFLALVQISGTATRTTAVQNVGPNGEVSSTILKLTGVPLPITSMALNSGIQGTTRASDFTLSDVSGELTVTLNRTEGSGGDITVGETLNFGGHYLTTGV